MRKRSTDTTKKQNHPLGQTIQRIHTKRSFEWTLRDAPASFPVGTNKRGHKITTETLTKKYMLHASFTIIRLSAIGRAQLMLFMLR